MMHCYFIFIMVAITLILLIFWTRGPTLLGPFYSPFSNLSYRPEAPNRRPKSKAQAGQPNEIKGKLQYAQNGRLNGLRVHNPFVGHVFHACRKPTSSCSFTAKFCPSHRAPFSRFPRETKPRPISWDVTACSYRPWCAQ